MVKFPAIPLILIIISTYATKAEASEINNLKFSNDGSFKYGESSFTVQFFDSNWKNFQKKNWQNKQEKTTGNIKKYTAQVNAGNQAGTILQEYKFQSENTFNWHCFVDFQQAVNLNSLNAALTVPITSANIKLDGKPVTVPPESDKHVVIPYQKINKANVRLHGGLQLEISGPMSAMIQDNRKFKSDTLTIRIAFASNSGNITKSHLNLSFKLKSVKNTPLDMRTSANRGFKDAIAGDGKGGWTDQGPENDLHAIQAGPLSVLGMDFNIIDGNKNNGKSAIIVGGIRRNFAPKEISLELPPGTSGKAINLLHASAWTPGGNLGEIEVTYKNNQVEKIMVSGQKDCKNWWFSEPGANAYIAWSTNNPTTRVGLYASSFPLSQNCPRKIIFRACNDKVVWMIAGVNLSDELISFPPTGEQDVYITAGKKYSPIEFNSTTKKGSALDFSWMLDAPAGKYGPLKINKAGHLTFEKAPQKRLKVYGINLCGSANFPSKQAAEEMAEKFSRIGYNSVRFHHHDNRFIDPEATDSVTFDKAVLDRFDYFYFVLKNQGIYITTDLYTSRKLKAGDNIQDYDKIPFKALIPISEAAMENWKTFAKKLLTHINPYTNCPLGEDPALIALNLVNEECLSYIWQKTPTSRKRYTELFNIWKETNNCPNATASNNDRYFQKFLYFLQKKALKQQITFIKDELKLKVPLASLNFLYDTPLTLLRSQLDIVDNHIYHSHARSLEKKWQLPFGFCQESAISKLGTLPRNLMPTRIFGKPFFVTEFNYCMPNRFRAEGGPLIGSYAALQNWDALYRFTWTHNIKRYLNAHAMITFEAVNDPVMQLSDRIAMLLFRRNDIKPSTQKISYPVDNNIFLTDHPLSFPSALKTLGLYCQVASHPTGSKLPPDVTIYSKKDQKKGQNLYKAKSVTSKTREISINANKNQLIIKTPFTESITLASGKLSTGKILSVENAEGFQSITVTTLDGKNLNESRHLLIFHLTNVLNNRMLFGNKNLSVLKNVGTLPLLLRKGSAKVKLALNKNFTVTALSADGHNLGNVKSVHNNNFFSFNVNTSCFKAGVMVYELKAK